MQQWECGGTNPSQKFRIHCEAQNYALELPRCNSFRLTSLTNIRCFRSINKRFAYSICNDTDFSFFIARKNNNNDAYAILDKINSLALDNNYIYENGSSISFVSPNQDDNQSFFFERVSDRVVSFRNKFSNRCIDSSTPTPTQSDCSWIKSQYWSIICEDELLGDSLTLPTCQLVIAAVSGNCLKNVYNSLVQTNCDLSDNSYFKASRITNMVYRFFSKSSDANVWTANGNISVNGILMQTMRDLLLIK